MNHWLLDSIAGKRRKALGEVDRIQFDREMGRELHQVYNFEELHLTATALELAVLDLEVDRFSDDNERRNLARQAAEDGFRLLRMLPPVPNLHSLRAGHHLLRAALLAVLGDRGADAARWLRTLEDTEQWPQLPLNSTDWGERCQATIIDVWLRLVRKRGWSDRDLVLERVASLRTAQRDFEEEYLASFEPLQAKRSALELIALYHLAKAADVLAQYITDGVVDDTHQIQPLLDIHFDRAIQACQAGLLSELEPLTRLMARATSQMVDNALWTVTRAVNSRVTQFVRELVNRGRGEKALFDVLPPQRRTLAERGLLGSSRRAVVVSLPTSSGKTLIAQFRILQALNQFEDQKGWVAYLAPTRALVNQVTRQLRRDFKPLGLAVERVSPVMEIDGIESAMLLDKEEVSKFRVLVATPEKLDLMLRQGWEEKIGRPLTLVVVDEAHTIQENTRGLRLELLLATINRECQNAQFLLLTPFIENGREVARWLGGQNSEDISLAVDWQPNDRAIGVVVPIKGQVIRKGSYSYRLDFQTVHTTRKTIYVDEDFSLGDEEALAKTFSESRDIGTLAAITAYKLKKRGPVIAMHQTPKNVWALAKKVKILQKRNLTEDLEFVRQYVKAEMGEDFPLIDLLAHRIGVHHGGLPDEIKILMEWLFEREQLDVLVATTTLAQGVNFPVSGVVMASTSYSAKNYSPSMPPEDFWNIAGRAGRVSQGQLGIVALVAKDEKQAVERREFIHRATGNLNSALIKLVYDAQDKILDLGRIVYSNPEWSSFLQYLVHTYQQMGHPVNYADQIEQVLRGTFGFEKLRISDSQTANKFLVGVRKYISYITESGKPLKLVDSTGFSLQSVITVLSNKGEIGAHSWKSGRLFSPGDPTLQKMMGILLQVPELRDNLEAVVGNKSQDGNKLALILKDWVSGEDLKTIAERHFRKDKDDYVTALTKCCQDLFGKLTQTSAWGLSALMAITASDLSEDERSKLINLPSQVFYGVATDGAVALRLLGIPRRVAIPLATHLDVHSGESLPALRTRVANLSSQEWTNIFGTQGECYRRAWQIIDGAEE